jgi:TolB protein
MQNLKSSLVVGALFFSFSMASAQPVSVAVGEAKEKKSVIALTPSNLAGDNAGAPAAQIEKIIESDLAFTAQFNLLPKGGFAQPKVSSLGAVQFGDWAKTGTDYLAFSTAKIEGGKVVYEFHLANIGGNKEVLAKRYTSDSDDTKILAHSVANDIVQAITGKRGIFLTKIAFACDKTGKKEIFTMNFDGSDVRQITKLRSIAMGAAWNPDGTRLAFSVYNKHSNNIKNIDLFEYSFKSGALKLLSNKKGINSGAAYAPSGNKLALTMSSSGNPEINVLNIDSKQATQITHSVGFDVDPAFSPDGGKIAFVSSRAGKPMVYVMTSSGGDVKRLTFAGQYNATPNWSPDGKKIVFAGWLDKHFDLFTVTADGSKIERLTKDEGNNEDPFYSPDGSFVAFTSGRSGGKNIFIMNANGGNVKRLTFGMGNCVAPKWSPYLN